jgi:hypothetical protein
VKVPPKVKVMVLLMNLLDTYKLLVKSLQFYEFTRLTWEVVTTKLLNEELMKKKNGDSSSAPNIAFVHTSHKNVGFKKIDKDKSQDICNYCKKKGHWVRNCMKKKDENLRNLTRKLIQRK